MKNGYVCMATDKEKSQKWKKMDSKVVKMEKEIAQVGKGTGNKA
jgi:hypothetical protein